MNSFRLSFASLAVISALGITACNDSANDAAPAAKSAVVSGVITNFGSVFVNGVKYETGGSTVSLDGTTAAESDLKIGMLVTLEGTINADGTTGVAKSVAFADEVEGYVSVINLDANGTGTMVVMGQTVTLDANTAFESKVLAITSMSQIAIGNIVEISGFSSGTGSILATRVEVKKAIRGSTDTVELKGVIASLDATAKTFVIGGLTVIFSDTTLLERITSTTLANGLFVEVHSSAGANVSGQLIASKIELKGNGKKGHKLEKDKHMELEGIVTAAPTTTTGIASFMLNGQVIRLATSTEYKGGTVDKLVVGVRVKIEVTADADGNIIAKEIKFVPEANIRFEGNLDSVDTANRTVTIMGQVIKLGNDTLTQDKRKEDGHDAVRHFGVTNLAAGQRVKIRAFKDANGAWIATKFERVNASTDPVELNAIIQAVGSVGSGTITVAGISVNISAITNTNTTLVVGKRVKLRGTFTNSVFTASSASVKSDNSEGGLDD